MTVIINATKARQTFFDILAAARDKKQVTQISYQGKAVAKLVPIFEEKFDWDNYQIELKKAVDYLSKFDWSDVLEVRKKTKARRYKGW